MWQSLLRKFLRCGWVEGFVVFIMVVTFLMSGCSSSYRPTARPYYTYPPPPAPSVSDIPAGQPAPATSGITSQTPSSQIPGKTSSIVEKTLEDSSSPAVPSKPTTQGKASEIVKTPAKKETPQTLASVKLVDDARQMRVKGKVDEAIRLLERAIEVDAYNGEAFYELALCWKAKGDMKKALSFADRAEHIYAGNPDKLKKVYLLKAQLLESAGSKEEAQKYRQKAR
jgi:hypothetical protein